MYRHRFRAETTTGGPRKTKGAKRLTTLSANQNILRSFHEWTSGVDPGGAERTAHFELWFATEMMPGGGQFVGILESHGLILSPSAPRRHVYAVSRPVLPLGVFLGTNEKTPDFGRFRIQSPHGHERTESVSITARRVRACSDRAGTYRQQIDQARPTSNVLERCSSAHYWSANHQP